MDMITVEENYLINTWLLSKKNKKIEDLRPLAVWELKAQGEDLFYSRSAWLFFFPFVRLIGNFE